VINLSAYCVAVFENWFEFTAVQAIIFDQSALRWTCGCICLLLCLPFLQHY